MPHTLQAFDQHGIEVSDTHSSQSEVPDSRPGLKSVSDRLPGIPGHQDFPQRPVHRQRRDQRTPPEPLVPPQSVQFVVFTPQTIGTVKTGLRGPKTKEQRDHAAKMWRIGSCQSCKKERIRCQPSHKSFQNRQANIATSSTLVENRGQGSISPPDSISLGGYGAPSRSYAILARAYVVVRRSVEKRRRLIVKVGKQPQPVSEDQGQSHQRQGDRSDQEMTNLSLDCPFSSQISYPISDYMGMMRGPFLRDRHSIYADLVDPSRQSFQHNENLWSEREDIPLPHIPPYLDRSASLVPQNNPHVRSADFDVAAPRGSPLNFYDWLEPSNHRGRDPLSSPGSIAGDALPTGSTRLPSTHDSHGVGNGRLNVLSLDGWGIRGYGSLVMLKQLTDRITRTEIARIDTSVDCGKDFIRTSRAKSISNIIGRTSNGDITPAILSRLHKTIYGCIDAYRPIAERVFGSFDAEILRSSIHCTINGLEKQPGLLDLDSEIWKVSLQSEIRITYLRETSVRELAQSGCGAAGGINDSSDIGSREDFVRRRDREVAHIFEAMAAEL
ncbi:uncharacterized protein PAC_09957 [Phialocephala subalpina]|uniref:Uncharacterized protein n=1 Tax=Phialocephala subalpina TaxID=576137 RepID=A0A1L7X4X4_9HELO|nr:uncharacterized protein PAC_09957 [Phialocephala subalpina]